jgi:hypothetical protein
MPDTLRSFEFEKLIKEGSTDRLDVLVVKNTDITVPIEIVMVTFALGTAHVIQ